MRSSKILILSVVASLSRIAAANVQYNGPNLNGVSISPDNHQLNGPTLDGTNGISLTGIQVTTPVVVNGQTLAPGPLLKVELGSTMLTGMLDGVFVTAQQLVGATLWANVINPDATQSQTPVQMQITAMQLPPYYVSTCHTVTVPCSKLLAAEDGCPDPVTICTTASKPSAGPNSDVNLYSVQYLPAGQTKYQYLCQNKDTSAFIDNDGLANMAIPVAGAWETRPGINTFTANGTVYSGGGIIPGTTATAFTFACRDLGALAKCLERDEYKPWKSGTAHDINNNAVSTSLYPTYQACVRMTRADYCGDGTSHTVAGTQIDVDDGDSIQAWSTAWGFEAQWGGSGAVCVSSVRLSDAATNSYVAKTCPSVNFNAQTTGSCRVDARQLLLSIPSGAPAAYLMDASSLVAP